MSDYLNTQRKAVLTFSDLADYLEEVFMMCRNHLDSIWRGDIAGPSREGRDEPDLIRKKTARQIVAAAMADLVETKHQPILDDVHLAVRDATMNMINRDQVSEALARLVQTGVLNQEEDGYLFRIPLVQAYIARYYQPSKVAREAL
ncbi:MAG: hypothetical protein HQK60_07335 [Deltaproteobacteria bacterium]|nr:hypothetical protein [Deltaproteobacteria bacterium]